MVLWCCGVMPEIKDRRRSYPPRLPVFSGCESLAVLHVTTGEGPDSPAASLTCEAARWLRCQVMFDHRRRPGHTFFQWMSRV